MKKIIIIIMLLVVGIVVYQNVSRSQDTSVIGGEKEQTSNDLHPSWDVNGDGLNDCEDDGSCDHTIDYTQPRETSQVVDPLPVVIAEKTGVLNDVTKGEVVRGVTTTERTTGFGTARLTDVGYELEVVFEALPVPQGDDFYEGWIVRPGDNFSVLSTGALVLEDTGTGSYSNSYRSDEDLLDHDFYVLTLEPNDGDPAPADHILEGALR